MKEKAGYDEFGAKAYFASHRLGGMYRTKIVKSARVMNARQLATFDDARSRLAAGEDIDSILADLRGKSYQQA